MHRWRLARNYQATLVFFPDSAGLRTAGRPVGPHWFDLDDTELRRTKDVLKLMRQEMKLERSAERRNRCLDAALQILIVNLGLDLPRHQDVAHLPKPYIELLNRVEDEPDWSRSVKDRSRRLGYSQRTLTRACLTTTGRTAKQIIDDRILLEAQRLLADSDSQVSSVAAALEFPDPANFSKFFHRLSDESPASWRSRNRPPDGEDG